MYKTMHKTIDKLIEQARKDLARKRFGSSTSAT
jgi:hypothetical protein